ncbi:MAG: S9 family peptidase [Xanthomonadaceae bacterium]|nr:S9 family peptidase [Xanthomonadaceae bacterium]
MDGYFNPDSEEIVLYRIDPRYKGNAILTRDIDLSKRPIFKPLVSHELNADFQLITSTKDGYLMITNHEAVNRKLIWIPKTAKSPKEWETIVAESKTAGYLDSIQIVSPFLLMNYVNNGVSVINIHKAADGAFVETMPSPGPGTIHSIGSGGKPGILVFTYESLVDQGSLYGYRVGTQKLVKLQPENPASPLKDFVYEHTTYKSEDGTEVPIQLLYHKDTKRDGSNPVYLHAYGGFGVNMKPEFNSKLFIWAQLGGIVAIPNIRGGAEMGGQWHLDGSLTKKQNSFNDFKAATKWLVAQGWTEHSRIGVEGGSNGGLLIAAMELQASDLIGAAIANVGVYDMMRFHKFTRGFHWINEYGSLRSKEEFQAMLKYSPVHNVTPAEYAPILISTGNKDDRVAPIHSFKLAAALQEAQKGTNPILLRVNANSAHGAGTRLEYVKQTAEEFAFFMEFLGMLTKEEKASSGQTPPP